ncbi:hypothetical protein AZF06_08415 [Priestia endophytica]|nr:hypothetical protein AZF06_08415 [Priestia endophytica]RAS77129.1 hypothetical protein A4U60_18325 [Priestia endophytica]
MIIKDSSLILVLIINVMVINQYRIFCNKKKTFAQYEQRFLHMGTYVNIMNGFVVSYTNIII